MILCSWLHVSALSGHSHILRPVLCVTVFEIFNVLLQFLTLFLNDYVTFLIMSICITDGFKTVYEWFYV